MSNGITAKEILIVLCIFCVGWFLDDIFRKLFKKRKQTCFVYCPKCTNELVSSFSFIEDIDGIVKYKCDKCGNISFWDFAHFPVPYLRTCASDCEHFYIDKTGHDYGCTRKGTCDPDTMVEFKQRRWEVKCEEETNVKTE